MQSTRRCHTWRLLRGLCRYTRAQPHSACSSYTEYALDMRTTRTASCTQAADRVTPIAHSTPSASLYPPLPLHSAASVRVPLLATRRALAARLAVGAFVPCEAASVSKFSTEDAEDVQALNSSVDESSASTKQARNTSSAAVFDHARELRFAGQRAVFAVHQVQRLINSGNDCCIDGIGMADGGDSNDSERHQITRCAFFASEKKTSGGYRDTIDSAAGEHSFPEAAWCMRCSPLDSADLTMEGLFTSRSGSLTGPETVAVLQWCAQEVCGLARALEVAAIARMKNGGASHGDYKTAEVDATATMAPIEMREAAMSHRRNDRETGERGQTDASTMARSSVFADPLMAVDLAEAAILMQSLLSQLLCTLVEGVLVIGTPVDSTEDELALAAISWDVTAQVVHTLDTILVRCVLPVVAEAERQRHTAMQATPSEATGDDYDHSAVRQGAYIAVDASSAPAQPSMLTPTWKHESTDEPSLMATIIARCMRGLSATDEVMLLAACSQRESPTGALALIDRLCDLNAAVAAAVTAAKASEHPSGDACETESVDGVSATYPRNGAAGVHMDQLSVRVSAKASYDVRITLAYIMAQHGAWVACLNLLAPEAGHTNASTDDVGGRALTRLILSLAAVNAPAGSSLPLNAAPTAAAPSSSYSCPRSTHTPLAFLTSEGDHSFAGEGLSQRHQRHALLSHLMSLGIAPNRPLSVAEYGALLKHMLRHSRPSVMAVKSARVRAGDFHAAPPRSQDHRGDISSKSNIKGSRPHASGATSTAAGDLNWALSPSYVWQHTACLPHHTRAALCLTGFQVLVRHDLADYMRMEDLLVVLSLTRQMRRARGRALVRRQRSLLLPQDEDGNARQATEADSDTNACSARDDHYVDDNEEAEAAEESVTALSGAFPCALLPAMRRTPPAGREHLVRLCEAFCAVRQRVYPTSTPLCPGNASAAATASSQAASTNHRAAATTRGEVTASLAAAAAAVMAPCGGGGSPMMLSVACHELLALLHLSHYTEAAPLLGEAVLAAASTVMAHEGLRPATVRILEELTHALIRIIDTVSTTGETSSGGGVRPQAIASTSAARSTIRSSGNGSVTATTNAALVTPTGSLDHLLDMLVRVAPYLSAFTVALVVQSQAGRYFTWQQCLQLASYAPLGSRSQTRLLRRVAQERADDVQVRARLRALVPRGIISVAAAAGSAMPSSTVMSASIGAAAATTTRAAVAPLNTNTATRTVPPPHSTTRERARAMVTDEQQMLSLLMEQDWHRALAQFYAAPPRVRAAGAPHLVRLVIKADAWCEVGEEQLRPMVRLAVRSTVGRGGSSTSSCPAATSAGIEIDDASGGGYRTESFAEEVLRATLAHGMWSTGLRFHQLVSEEQPGLLKGRHRAQAYAAMLCKGLMERTVLARTIADVSKAARAGQWAKASAHFVLYATGNDIPNSEPHANAKETRASVKGGACGGDGDGVERLSDRAPAKEVVRTYPRLSKRMAQHILDTAMAAFTARDAVPMESTVRQGGEAQAERSSRADSTTHRSRGLTPSDLFHLRSSGSCGWPIAASVPAGLVEFAQTVRYALLRTPQTRDVAFRWFPAATLPVPLPLRIELKTRYDRAFLVANRIVVPNEPRPTATATDPDFDAAAVGTTTTTSSEGESEVEVKPSTAQQSAPPASVTTSPSSQPATIIEAARRGPDCVVRRLDCAAVTTHQEAVHAALEVLHARGHWTASLQLYQYALQEGTLPYKACATVLRTTLTGGAPWWVTLSCFEHMAHRARPDILSTTAALEACEAGGQWEMALKVLRQSVLTTSRPPPRIVELTIRTALHCGAWTSALRVAHAHRATRSPQLTHTVLQTYAAAQHWNELVELFYECTLRGVRLLDASIELALVAAEAASREYRRTAMLVGAIASALEDLYTVAGAVLEHVTFVYRHRQLRLSQVEDQGYHHSWHREQSDSSPVMPNDTGAFAALSQKDCVAEEGRDYSFNEQNSHGQREGGRRRRHRRGCSGLIPRTAASAASVSGTGAAVPCPLSEDWHSAAAWTPLLLQDPPYWEAFTHGTTTATTGPAVRLPTDSAAAAVAGHNAGSALLMLAEERLVYGRPRSSQK